MRKEATEAWAVIGQVRLTRTRTLTRTQSRTRTRTLTLTRYGNYISMMGLIDKGYAAPGEIILREGGAVDHFYALLSGKVEVLSDGSDASAGSGGKVEVLNVVRAGEDCYFGETEPLHNP